MKGYFADVTRQTERNAPLRHVLYAGRDLELVLMAFAPGQGTGRAIRSSRDQFLRIECGSGALLMRGRARKFQGGDGIIIPAGAWHTLTNTGEVPLRLSTLHGPRAHIYGLVETHRPAVPSGFMGAIARISGRPWTFRRAIQP